MGGLIEELEAKLAANKSEYELKWKEFLHLRRLSTTSQDLGEEKRRVECDLATIDRRILRLKYDIKTAVAKEDLESPAPVIVPVPLPKSLVAKLKELADKQHLSLHSYIREILETVVPVDNEIGAR